MGAIQCQTVDIIIEQGGFGIGRWTIPAYTRHPDDCAELLHELVDQYMDLYRQAGSSVSIADFALQLIRVAADDPRFIED